MAPGDSYKNIVGRAEQNVLNLKLLKKLCAAAIHCDIKALYTVLNEHKYSDIHHNAQRPQSQFLKHKNIMAE